MVRDVGARLAEHGVTISLTAAAKDWLAGEGDDREFGARPLRRAVQRYVETPLSARILGKEFSSGDHVLVDAAEGGLSFARAETPVAVIT